MRFEAALLEGRLEKRYKRFLADVRLADGVLVTAHCPNTGAMTGCKDAGSRVWLRPTDNPKRKLKYSWELVETADGALACIHSARANDLLAEALAADAVAPLAGYTAMQREARFGRENSRADFLLHYGEQPCYVEVKSVTLARDGGIGLFPDAVSSRGTRHLRELIEVRREGARAVLCFVVMHGAIREVRPADEIDPLYGETLREARAAGVELLAFGTRISAEEISLDAALPVCDSQAGG